MSNDTPAPTPGPVDTSPCPRRTWEMERRRQTVVSAEVIAETLSDGSIEWRRNSHDGSIEIETPTPDGTTAVFRAAVRLAHALEADNPSLDAEDILLAATVTVFNDETIGIAFPNLTTD